jgi:hypothetical protein
MTDRLILPRHYSERPALDLRKVHFTRKKGPITVFGTWHRQPDGESRPCLVLVCSYWPPRRWTPCIVRIDTAWLWTEEAGNPVRATEEAMHFAPHLGLDLLNARDIVKIIAAVRDCLNDLRHMPPAPPGEIKIVGEAAIVEVESGDVIEQKDVVDRV